MEFFRLTNELIVCHMYQKEQLNIINYVHFLQLNRTFPSTKSYIGLPLTFFIGAIGCNFAKTVQFTFVQFLLSPKQAIKM